MKELTMGMMISITSALTGIAKLRIFSTFEETANLYTILLASPGTGKTPACKIGCINPVVHNLERTKKKQFVFDEPSSSGVFSLISNSSQDFVPIICVDEAYTFLNEVFIGKKESISMDRLCKLYDGDYWYKLNGTSAKRRGVASARASMCCLLTPKKFLEQLWPKIIDTNNGLADRIMLFHVQQEEKSLEDIEKIANELDTGPLKDLTEVYNYIYDEHHTDQPPRVYQLDPEAKTIFYAFNRARLCNSENVAPKMTASKTTKQIMKLTLTLHILYHRLRCALNPEIQHTPTPLLIKPDILNNAISLHSTLQAYSELAATACVKLNTSESVRFEVLMTDIQEKILSLPGPFHSRKRIYNSYSSANRPTPDQTQQAMENLQSLKFGFVKKIGKAHVFYKQLPSKVIDFTSSKMTEEAYKMVFVSKDPIPTKKFYKKMIDEHPQKDLLLVEDGFHQSDDEAD
ncbi:uncharacterized protein [Clytia hemisphaerica]